MGAHAGNHHELVQVQFSFALYVIEVMPENLIGDKAWDSSNRWASPLVAIIVPPIPFVLHLY